MDIVRTSMAAEDCFRPCSRTIILQLAQRLAIGPRHPLGPARVKFSSMPLQLGQVIKRVGPAQLAGMDQGHEQIAHLRAVQSLVELCVFPMKHGPLQGLFADVVVERGSRVMQECRQPFPVRNR